MNIQKIWKDGKFPWPKNNIIHERCTDPWMQQDKLNTSYKLHVQSEQSSFMNCSSLSAVNVLSTAHYK
jgi:hypothetical protein